MSTDPSGRFAGSNSKRSGSRRRLLFCSSRVGIGTSWTNRHRAGSAAADESSLLKKTIGTLGTILTYNFFIIIGFFTWFMTGVVAQFGFQQTALIDAFRGAWDYVIQPLLGTHMTLTFLSYGLEKVAAGDGEDEYTKYNR